MNDPNQDIAVVLDDQNAPAENATTPKAAPADNYNGGKKQ
jgi:hypothetical protein